MKLIRYGEPGCERPGLVDLDGCLRDLSGFISDIEPGTIAGGLLTSVSQCSDQEWPLVPGRPRLGPPLAHVGKFIAIGLNYVDHALEAGVALPEEPVIFSKATSCIAGPHDAIMLPRHSIKTDWEVELGVVIGKRARYVAQEEALDYVLGYCVVNDVSEREYQLERGGTWDKGKGCDTFGPIGPWLVTKDEIPDPQSLELWLDLNGERRQRGNTRSMVFDVSYLVSYLSRFMTLLPGDLITTGTPPGVGMGQKPHPRFLQPADVIDLGIRGLGEQRQEVIAWMPG